MRHGNKINHLGRTNAHRSALLANLAASLIKHKRIQTTLAKAKELRGYVEPLLTKTKNLTSVTEKTHAQRVVFSYLKDKEAVKELFTEIGPKIEARPGGYTRILKLGNRMGDNADICIIELVDYNENMLGTKDVKKDKTRRSRRPAAKKKTDETEITEETSVKTKVATGEKTKKKAEKKTEDQIVEDVKNEVADVKTDEPAATDEKQANTEPPAEEKEK